MISGREARQEHRAGATQVPWEHTTYTSGAASAAVDLLGAGPERQVGGRLGKGAMGERLRLGEEVSWTTAVGIFCAEPWEYFLYGFVTCMAIQFCLSFLQNKWSGGKKEKKLLVFNGNI